jgi:hypothetical protein
MNFEFPSNPPENGRVYGISEFLYSEGHLPVTDAEGKRRKAQRGGWVGIQNSK